MTHLYLNSKWYLLEYEYEYVNKLLEIHNVSLPPLFMSHLIHFLIQIYDESPFSGFVESVTDSILCV